MRAVRKNKSEKSKFRERFLFRRELVFVVRIAGAID